MSNFSSFNKILIIGGTGFLGKSFSSFFANQPEIELTLTSRSFTTETKVNNIIHSHLSEIDAAKYDLIIHAAANASPQYNVVNPILSFEESIKTSKEVYNSNVKAKYLYISSGCVENTTSSTYNSYLESKRVGELYAQNLKNLDAKIIRLYSVIGKDIDLKSSLAINTFIDRAKRGSVIEVSSDAGKIIRSYLDADEMCENILKFSRTNGKICEIGSASEISIDQVANQVCDFFKVDKVVVENKFYSNTFDRQMPKSLLFPSVMSSSQAIQKNLEYFKNE
jgi:nucleoside-diphosphate-sugar epimerase